MPEVQTVQGPVDAGELGYTLIHEHVRSVDEATLGAVARASTTPDGELAAALEAVTAAKDHGVQTIVEPTAMLRGRDVGFMRRVAEQTGVRLIPCTGIYTYDYLPLFFADPQRGPDRRASSSPTSSRASRAPTSRRPS